MIIIDDELGNADPEELRGMVPLVAEAVRELGDAEEAHAVQAEVEPKGDDEIFFVRKNYEGV